MALFVNPGKDSEKNMSEEDIAQMESQGYDVTELRAKRAKSAEEEEKERLREKEERENFKNRECRHGNETFERIFIFLDIRWYIILFF